MSDESVVHENETRTFPIEYVIQTILQTLKNGKETCHLDREGETQTRAEQ